MFAYHADRTHAASDFVLFYALEPPHVIEVDVSKFGLFDHLRVESSFKFHHQPQHMIVGPSREKNFASIELIQRTTYGPHIQGSVIWQAQDCGRRDPMSNLGSVGEAK
jgi:hypothetical protein